MEPFANNEILSFLWLYRQIIWITLSTITLIVSIIIWWDKVKYFFMNVGYSLPFFGKIARSKNSSLEKAKGDWFHSERKLCDDFYSYYQDNNKSAEHYDKCRNYLSKCQEIGRRKKGFLLSVLLIFLILFEAVGFAYVLAPFMVQNVSADDASMLAWFTAFLLSIAAVFLTDKMGEEIHFNSLINKIRTWRDHDTEPVDLMADPEVRLETTYKDDNKKVYIQLLNRVEANAKVTPKKTITIITILYILIIAIGAFFVRSYTLDSIETEMINNASSPFASNSSLPTNSSPFDLPTESQSFNQSADKQAGNEQKEALHMASLTTFIILSVIFIAIQVLGIMFGYLYSLSGRESAIAWKDTKGFNSAEEFVNYYQRKRDKVARDAQAKLSALQDRLSNRITTSSREREAILKGVGHKDFEQYLNEKKKANETSINISSEVNSNFVPEEPKESIASDKTIESPENNITEEKSIIDNLGDISEYDDQDIVMLAEGTGVDVEKLRRIKKIQLQVNAVKQKR